MEKRRLSSFIGSFFMMLVILSSLFIQFQVAHGEIIKGKGGRRMIGPPSPVKAPPTAPSHGGSPGCC
ncbi:hypothetical protein J5N97_007476 [Dioscorea zingiberensis]|uniref:Transmembrane protein n=1 Tax=Dioscorea zingiberensis TaxID=325984 RepID=A0A9D5DCC1_9LILI|nr:hypothetical protein J5N97_007476 [Dioscorea zingiberensis]